MSVLEMFTGGIVWQNGLQAPDTLKKYRSLLGPKFVVKMPKELGALLEQCLTVQPDGRPEDMPAIVKKLQAIYSASAGQAYPRQETEAGEHLADSLNNRALSLLDLGKEPEALNLFEKALATDPHHLEVTYNRGLLLWRSAKTTDDQVIKQLEEAGKSHPGDSRTNYLVGLVHLERGDAESAVRVLSEAAKVATQSPAIELALMTALQGLGKWGRCLRTFEGHSDHIWSVAISSDGRRVLSGGKDNTLRLWDSENGQCLRIFEGSGFVWSVAISPNGRWGVSGSYDETLLRLWDLATGECLRTFEGHSDFVLSVAISPDGRRVLSGSQDNTLRLWDLATGQCLRTFEGRAGAVAISPDGRRGLSGSWGRTLGLWELATGQCLRTFEGHSRSVASVAISSDGRWVLSGSDDKTLRLWELESGKCLRTFEGHTSAVESVAISPNGHWGLSGSHDATLRLWDLATGQCLRTFEGHARSVAISPDGRWGLSGSLAGTLRRWELVVPDVRSSLVPAVPQRSHELLRQRDEFVRAVETAETHLRKGEIREALRCLAVARGIRGHERDDAATSLLGRVACYCRSRSLSGGWLLRTIEGDPGGVISVAISPDGRRGLSGGGDALRLWDLETGHCLRTFEVFWVQSVAFSPNGHLGFSEDCLNVARLWDLETGRCLCTFEGIPDIGFFNSIAISPDGRWGLATGANSGDLDLSDCDFRLCDLVTGRCLRTFQGHSKDVTTVAISPDGRWGLSGSNDKTLRLWNLATGECLRIFEGHSEWVTSVAISPDGFWGLSGSMDGKLRLWELASSQCLRTFEGHSSSVNSVAISPDGRWGLSGNADSTLQLWELATGQCMRTFEGHSSSVASVAISSDGRWVLSGSDDKTLRLWELDWEYEFPGWADWDECARPYLDIFLTLHCPTRPDGFTRVGKPTWTEEDFQRLIKDLQHRGYGWLRPEGVRHELEKMALRAFTFIM